MSNRSKAAAVMVAAMVVDTAVATLAAMAVDTAVVAMLLLR